MVIYISIIYIFGSQWFMVIPPLAAHQSMSVHLAAEGPKALGGKLLQVRDRTAIFTLRPRPSHGTMESPWKFCQGKGGFQKSEVNMNIMKYHEISWNIMKYHEYPLNQHVINIYPCRWSGKGQERHENLGAAPCPKSPKKQYTRWELISTWQPPWGHRF